MHIIAHEEKFLYGANKWNDNDYQLKTKQLILKDSLLKSKSGIDGTNKHESELKSKSEKIIQRTQERLISTVTSWSRKFDSVKAMLNVYRE